MKRTIVSMMVCVAGLALLVQPASAQFRGRSGPPQRPEVARDGPSEREQALARQVQALQEQLKRIEQMLANAQATPQTVQRERPQARPEARPEARSRDAERQKPQAAPAGERHWPPAGPLGRGPLGGPGPREQAVPSREVPGRGGPPERADVARQAPSAREQAFRPEVRALVEQLAREHGRTQTIERERPQARLQVQRPPVRQQVLPRGPWGGGDPSARGREALRQWAQSRQQERTPLAERFRQAAPGPRRPEYGRREQRGPAGAQGIAAQVRLLVEDARRLLARAEQLERQLGQSHGPEGMRQGPPRPPARQHRGR